METKHIYIGINTESGEIVSCKSSIRLGEIIGYSYKTITNNCTNTLSGKEYNGWRIAKIVLLGYNKRGKSK